MVFFTCMFWHKYQKNTSPGAMTISSFVPCPAMVRHCQTLWHSEGCSGHAPLQVLCLPRGLPRMPGTVLPGVGPQGYGCCAELPHLDHPSGGHECMHIAWSSCASVSSCVWGCSAHTRPQLMLTSCLSFCAGCTVSCSPAGLGLSSCLYFCLQGATLPSPALVACPSPKPGLTGYLWLGWARCPAAWEVCTAAAMVTAVGWSIPLLQTPLAHLDS